jgi:hypothetical protein
LNYVRDLPINGFYAGYSALIVKYKLKTPIPFKLTVISEKYSKYDSDEWLNFSVRYKPEDTLKGHLTFALKYEGIDLSVLKALFTTCNVNDIVGFIKEEPTGSYNRKIWFLYEWLLDKKLDLKDLKTGNYIDLIDERLQYAGSSENSARHRIKNNLPGVRNFCPLIRKTERLESFIKEDLISRLKDTLVDIPPDIIKRTAAFILLSDSKASFNIEGEKPPQDRIQRWADVIAQAGVKELSVNELIILQKILIGESKFIRPGLRTEGGFVGRHNKITYEPEPEHISARWQDLPVLMEGLINAGKKMESEEYDAVLAAASVSFGFIFIHPFEDGNGRIHRYLINDVLARKNFTEKGFIFPVSYEILSRIYEYRQVLESFSASRKNLICWKITEKNNIEVLNETIDLYRYFDATEQAEFLFSCIKDTIEKLLPGEIKYLVNYDRMRNYLNNNFELPEKLIDLMIIFLNNNKGRLSKRARENEFSSFNENEIEKIEDMFKNIFEITN